ncbi:MAG: glycosyltransferase [Kiritimatiellaeota bacterium]|nr:glycosyltransferase [Kiritimatiellota bacterium]
MDGVTTGAETAAPPGQAAGADPRKARMVEMVERLAASREKYQHRNRHYYAEMLRFFRYHVPKGSRVLEIGCGLGDLLAGLEPATGVGIDISAAIIERARQRHSGLQFVQADAEELRLPAGEPFDYILLTDIVGYFADIQQVFQKLRAYAGPQTRILVTQHNYFWQPLLRLAECIGLKMPQPHLNWLNEDDVQNLLYLEGYEVIRAGQKLLLPAYVPLLSAFCNRVLANLPGWRKLGLVEFTIARMLEIPARAAASAPTVSVIIPARNEAGNIEAAVQRMPEMGGGTELIFVEGNSTDDTAATIVRVAAQYAGRRQIVCATQPGRGKADAVRKGFALATGDILMILDADLTMPPEELPRFYAAIASGRGEFVNGSRLVYPQEKGAMRSLNMLGNKFFSLMFTYLLDQHIKDTLCGTKVLTRKNYERLTAGRAYFGDFDPFGDFDLLFGAAKLDLKIVEVPVHYRARTYGDTNIARWRHGWLLLKMVLFAMNKIKFT